MAPLRVVLSYLKTTDFIRPKLEGLLISQVPELFLVTTLLENDEIEQNNHFYGRHPHLFSPYIETSKVPSSLVFQLKFNLKESLARVQTVSENPTEALLGTPLSFST